MAASLQQQLQQSLKYWAADHPAVAHFRWEENSTLGASWSFVAVGLAIYVAAIVVLKLLVSLRKGPVPLSLIQTLHNLLLLLSSAGIFIGCARATALELQQTKWLWEGSGKAGASFKWLLCFPAETRPAGRIFFWSYVYYLTKFYELLDTLIIVLRKRHLTLFHVLQHAGNLLVCFSWLHFAQSLQVVFLLTNTSIQTLLYGYFFLTSLGYDPPVKRFVTLCQIFQFLVSLVASAGLLSLVRRGEKCSGTNACAANAAFNLLLMLLLINYYIRVYVKQPAAKTGKKSRHHRTKKAE